MLDSGLTDPRDYLMPDRDRATVWGTAIGLIPIVAIRALVQGAILGLAGGALAAPAGGSSRRGSVLVGGKSMLDEVAGNGISSRRC